MESENKKNWYDKNYKKILFLPAIFLVFSIIYLGIFQANNGDIILKDVSLTGGTTVTVLDEVIDVNKLEASLRETLSDVRVSVLSEFGTGNQKGFIVETQTDSEQIKNLLEKELGYTLTQDNSSIEFSGSALTTGFYQQIRFAVLISFFLMSAVVFLIFRSFIPSFAIILSAFADIIMTIVVVDLLGIRLSIAGIIAFLMLIGYSVDTDILLTSRLLKNREGSLNERMFAAFKTGIMMTITSIAAFAISFFIMSGVSEILRQIFGILLIGLVFDIINTWMTNAGILKWYVEKGGRKI